MASPSTTHNVSVLSSQALGAGSSVNADWDLSSKFEGRAQVSVAFGGSPDGDLLVEVFALHDPSGTPDPDTEASLSFVIEQATSTTKEDGFALPTGSWRITLTNQDSTDSVTVDVEGWTVDSVA